MLVDLTTIKLFTRVDSDDEDTLLQLMYDKAVADLNDSLDFEVSEENTDFMSSRALPKVKLLILIMISNMFDNRELMTEKSINKYNFTVQSNLLQLQYCYSDLIVEESEA